MITVQTPIQPAVSVTEVKQWLRLPDGACGAAEEAVIATLTHAATDALEEILRRKMLNATVLNELKQWNSRISLPWNPFVELVTFEYRDEEGDFQEVDPELYELLPNKRPAVIVFHDDARNLPELFDKTEYPIRITYTVGESETIDDVPYNYKQRILMAVATGYMNRASLTTKSLQSAAMKEYLNDLTRNKRVMRFS